MDRAPSGDEIQGGQAAATSARPNASAQVLIAVGGRAVPARGGPHCTARSDLGRMRSHHRRGHVFFRLCIFLAISWPVLDGPRGG